MSRELVDYLIHFVSHGNPNGPGNGLIEWPQYDPESKKLLTLLDNETMPLSITPDTYREGGMKKLTELSLKFPL